MNLLSPVFALIITAIVITFLLRSRFSQLIQDVPNERSLHDRVVPRTGGIGLLLGVMAGWAWSYGTLVWWLVVPLLGLFVISILDDKYTLSVKQRLWVHLAAAALLVWGAGVVVQHGVFWTAMVFFFAVWMINLYNFMDGSDGLAGGMALFGFACYGIAALLAQDENLAWANFTIAAAAMGFLLFNFHPASIFMGDAGSIPLGFLAVAMGVWGVQRGDWFVWFPIVVFSPFIVDASVTLMKRTLRGVKITEAHREHYYQRAIQMGAGHRNVALFEYGLMLFVGVLALWARSQRFPWESWAVCALVYAYIMYSIDVRWKRRGQAVT